MACLCLVPQLPSRSKVNLEITYLVSYEQTRHQSTNQSILFHYFCCIVKCSSLKKRQLKQTTVCDKLLLPLLLLYHRMHSTASYSLLSLAVLFLFLTISFHPKEIISNRSLLHSTANTNPLCLSFLVACSSRYGLTDWLVRHDMIGKV